MKSLVPSYLLGTLNNRAMGQNSRYSIRTISIIPNNCTKISFWQVILKGLIFIFLLNEVTFIFTIVHFLILIAKYLIIIQYTIRAMAFSSLQLKSINQHLISIQQYWLILVLLSSPNMWSLSIQIEINATSTNLILFICSFISFGDVNYYYCFIFLF